MIGFKISYNKRTMKISVIAHPNSKKPRVEKDLLRTLHVYVNAPPLEGRANKAIIEALSKYFKVKKGNVVFISGTKSKSKTFEIIRD